jgi:putative lipase involved disintegration of autophagic bodies
VVSQLQVRPNVSFLYIFPRYLAWQDNRLFETRMWPVGVASYDLSDPAHPVAKAELTYHGSVAAMIAGSGHTLYLPWQAGVLEFRAVGDGLRAERYLGGDKAVSALAMAGESVYTLTDADKQKRRWVQAFLVGR